MPRYKPSERNSALRSRCIRSERSDTARAVTRFHATRKVSDDAAEQMRRAIDSPEGRRLYSQRIATVEPVFANLRHNKGLDRLMLRGRAKVRTQWLLYCLVHNIEKISRAGYGS